VRPVSTAAAASPPRTPQPCRQSAMLKPRLFSTLRCLQHENPLVSVLRPNIDFRRLTTAVTGPPALRRTSAAATHAARSAATTKHKGCKEGHRRVFSERRCGKEYNSGYLDVALEITASPPLTRRSQPCAQLRTPRLQSRYPRRRHLWPLDPHAPQSVR
jgi:hypothetical protein